MRVLCFDPSGNWGKEGMGTTGWALFENGILTEFGDISAADFENQEDYWRRHLKVLLGRLPDVVVCESYKLQAGKAMAQSWSTLDTPQLIGCIRMTCYDYKIPIEFQNPSDKVRVADPQLVHMRVIEKKGRSYTCNGKPTNLHMRDAIRHGIFWHRYGRGKELLNGIEGDLSENKA